MWDHKGLLGYKPRWQRILERVAEALMLPLAFAIIIIAGGLWQ